MKACGTRGSTFVLFLVIVLSGVRLWALAGVAADDSRMVLRDSQDYLRLAAALRTTGAFHDPEVPALDAIRTPVYPAFVALLLALSGGRYWPIGLAQIVVGALVSLGLWKIGDREFGCPTGAFSAILFFFMPNALFWSLTILAEIVLAAALFGFICLAMRVARSKTGYLLLGLAAGLLPFVKPVTLPVALLASLWASIFVPRGPGLRDRLVTAALVLAPALLLIGAWTGRNYLVHGDPRFSPIGEDTVRGYHLGLALARGAGISIDAAMEQIDRYPGLLHATWEVVRAYPIEFLEVQALGWARTSLGIEAGTWWKVVTGEELAGSGLLQLLILGGRENPSSSGDARLLWPELPYIGLTLWGLLATLLLFGPVLVWLGRNRVTMGSPEGLVCLLSLGITLYLILSSGAAGQARLRVGAEPLLALVAGYSLALRYGNFDNLPGAARPAQSSVPPPRPAP